ncbi:MAG TPA: DinB family protein [Pirellulaceae bacterium]|nr:DinB family protein [Pirellulaceae bacterium]
MDARQAILANLASADFTVDGYLADIQPAEMLARAVPGSNHLAWQIGHLIQSERYLAERCQPGSICPLPAGFEARHKKETAGSDNPADFLSKEEYQRIRGQVRADVSKLIESLKPEDLDKPVDKVPPFLKTVGQTLLFLGPHWLMHAGQWAVIRRKLGRPPLF